MTDKIIAIAAMLDATDGEQDNASRILQRMLASQNKTLTEFIRTGLEKIGTTVEFTAEVMADAIFPFDTARIKRLTAKFKSAGLSWRNVASGRTNTSRIDDLFEALIAHPYDTQFENGTRTIVRKDAKDKDVYEWKREGLPEVVIALVKPLERSAGQMLVNVYTQNSLLIISYGDFLIKGEEQIEMALKRVKLDRAMILTLEAPKNIKKPMIATIIEPNND